MKDYWIIVTIAEQATVPKVSMTAVPYLSSRRPRRGMVRSLLVSSIVSTRGRVRVLTLEYGMVTLID